MLEKLFLKKVCGVALQVSLLGKEQPLAGRGAGCFGCWPEGPCSGYDP